MKMTTKTTNADWAALPARNQMEFRPGGALGIWAPAKINLNLLVGPRRPDGFHPVDSYVAKVTLYDQIDLAARADGQFALHCTGADCGHDHDNLALRAARLLAETFPRPDPFGVDITLTKHIPPGKGLGGGSADAAAVLAGLNEVWDMGLAADQLLPLAARLGSDVPLFLGPAAARMTGRGEIIAPAQIAPFLAVLFLSDCFCATAPVYRTFDQSPQPMAAQLDTSILASAPPSAWRARLQNQLFDPALAVCPALGQLWQELSAALPVPVHMTGSGSALFALFDDEKELAAATAALPQKFKDIATTVRANPW